MPRAVIRESGERTSDKAIQRRSAQRGERAAIRKFSYALELVITSQRTGRSRACKRHYNKGSRQHVVSCTAQLTQSSRRTRERSWES